MVQIDRDNEREFEYSSTARPKISSNQPGDKSLSANSRLSSNDCDSNHVLLSTATVFIADSSGYWHSCNALLDSGSQSNLISESLCRKLKLKQERINIPLSGVSQVITNVTSRTRTVIRSRFKNYNTELSFLVLPVLTEKLPLMMFETSNISYPKYIDLADENFNIPKKIDLLLGAEIFYDLLESGKIKLEPHAITLRQTCLGWIFTGSLNLTNSDTKKVRCNFSTKVTNRALQDSLTKFWEIEDLGDAKYLSKNEQYCEDYFKLTTTRNASGTFKVRYPFNQNVNIQLGESKSIALKRFLSLEKRLSNNKHLKHQYEAFMNEYKDLGHMTLKCSLNEDDSIENKSYFLPHSAVLRESITTKCRVVFDASAKSSTNVSFNDLILVGPTIQQDLFSILLRVRLESWAEFASQLNYLNDIKIKRHVLKQLQRPVQLYGFCDSSEKAYGACIYICSIDETGKKHINLLTAKSKVAPVKKQTLPRLELLAAHLSAKLMAKIKNILNISISKTVYFTDSTIVLAWIRLEPSSLKTFVANRVARIIELSHVIEWNHVVSEDNAADIISRGVNPKELVKNNIWFQGPSDSLASHAEEDVTHLNPARLNRYQHLLQLYQQFWKRWSREYLTSLQVRTKWKAGTENPVKIGSLVILMENNTPPLKWPLARVIELYPGTDNIVRVVSVRLPNGTIVRRTLSKVCVLPVESAHEN
ncbi:hypothetical protein D910_04816 [Dendroctonus ponderosae]|uniref:DUF5641 domain-containing protein n=1 Tax=Dendroctonus ponderosae TaxID=77166 RepID=U4U302_DENPD|nr:hypothetical protein D910_04816 [Dendroctonus ponderosae]